MIRNDYTFSFAGRNYQMQGRWVNGEFEAAKLSDLECALSARGAKPAECWRGPRGGGERGATLALAQHDHGNPPQQRISCYLPRRKTSVKLVYWLLCVGPAMAEWHALRHDAEVHAEMKRELGEGALRAALVMELARRVVRLLLFVLTAGLVWAQPGGAPRFEVAVIKPAPGCALGQNGGGKVGLLAPGRIQVECATMWNLIGGSYAVDERLERQRVQIEGGPGWLKSETYSVTAKADNGNAPVPMMMGPMMRALLEERLGLKTHGETREGPVYELAVTKGGLKAKLSTPGSCVPADLNRPPQEQHPNSSTHKNCGFRNLRARNGMVMEATGVTMSELARSLPLDRETIDRTGIAGRFDFVLRYSTEDVPGPGADSGIEPSPGILTAIVEQLGLRISRARGPLQLVIIDSVEKPTDN